VLVAGHLYAGLIQVGSWAFPADVGEYVRRAPDVSGADGGPAPGHPERLVPDQPLSETERSLWRDLS
jgi:hypothetical protein